MLTKSIIASFRELGPPDLCHVVKTSGSKSAPKDVSGSQSFSFPRSPPLQMGSYHYW